MKEALFARLELAHECFGTGRLSPTGLERVEFQ